MLTDSPAVVYNSVYRCSKCRKESSSPSVFYELDLSLGSKSDVTLDECLAEFLHEEKLEGSDQYFCENCGSKQNATRSIRLRHLPVMLNIQLLRFVFDRYELLICPFFIMLICKTLI